MSASVWCAGAGANCSPSSCSCGEVGGASSWLMFWSTCRANAASFACACKPAEVVAFASPCMCCPLSSAWLVGAPTPDTDCCWLISLRMSLTSSVSYGVALGAASDAGKWSSEVARGWPCDSIAGGVDIDTAELMVHSKQAAKKCGGVVAEVKARRIPDWCVSDKMWLFNRTRISHVVHPHTLHLRGRSLYT